MIAILRFSEEHQNLGADQRRQQHPQTEIVNLFFWQAIARSQLYRNQDRAKKCQRQEHAIGIDGETVDAEKFREHGLEVRGQKSEIRSQQKVAARTADYWLLTTDFFLSKTKS